jgi:VIT1/CCC1 family predicted Fe2+/Mn2+ transporter
MNQYGKFPKLPRMAMAKRKHRTKRIGWLRAAVLGANDGHPFA